MKLFGLLFKPFKKMPGWYTCADPRYQDARDYTKYWTQLSGLAKELAGQAQEQNYQVFCGLFDREARQPKHQLFAISGIDPCQPILDFRVGSHNRANLEQEEKEIKAVYKQMKQIYKVRKFRPYFVDAAGYHCRFDGQITEAEAEKVEELFRYGGEWYVSHFDDTDTAPIIVRENELHLWWD